MYEYVTVRDISAFLAARIAAEANRDATKLNEHLAKKVSLWRMVMLYALQSLAIIAMAALLSYPAYLVVRLFVTILRDASLAVALVLLPCTYLLYDDCSLLWRECTD